MAQKKTARQQRSAQRQKEIRSGLAALKRKGLYAGDAKRAKGNSYQASLVKQYADVIKSEATVLKVGSKAAKALKGEGARVKRDRVVVDVSPKERVTFNKKTGAIVGRRQFEGRTIVRNVIYQHTFSPSKLPKPPKGVEYRYRVGFSQPKRGGTTYTAWWPSVADLQNFLNTYKNAMEGNRADKKSFQSLWTNSVEIQEVKRPKSEEIDEDIEDGFEDVPF